MARPGQRSVPVASRTKLIDDIMHGSWCMGDDFPLLPRKDVSYSTVNITLFLSSEGLLYIICHTVQQKYSTCQSW